MRHVYDTPTPLEEHIGTIRDVIAAEVNDARTAIAQAIKHLDRASTLGALVDEEAGALEDLLTDLGNVVDNLEGTE